MRTSTAELFQAVSVPPDGVTLMRLLESQKTVGLTMALDLGAAIAERVGAIHASGRLLGAFDASRVVCTRDGRVLLAQRSEHPSWNERNEPGLPLAPELKRGEPASAAADVYAVGFLVYQLLTGKTPAQASAAEEVSRLREVPAPSRFNDKVDAELDAVVLAALRVEPSERPAVMALQAALDGISEELALIPEPEVIGALVAKLLAEPKTQPVPEPRPSPGAAVATSKLQAAFVQEAPLFPGRTFAEPVVRPEALTTNRFEPWLPPSPPAPAPDPVPAGRSTKTDPLLPAAQVTAPFEPAQELKDTVPIRAPRSSPVTPPPLPPSASQAVKLAAAVQLVEEPLPSVVVAPSLEALAAVFPDEALAQQWLQKPGAKTFIDADYREESQPELLVTPGFIAGASTAGVVMLLALVLALLTPSSGAPQVNGVDEQPVRHRTTVRPVEVAPAPKPMVVAKAQPAPVPAAKKKVVKAAPVRSHAVSNPRRGVAP